MKLLSKLEKSFSFWFLIFSSIIFFLLRLPSLFEPYWYGDEGVYQAVGMLVRNGAPLYSGAWDNKPPLLYVLYAIFNSDQFVLRSVSLIFGLMSVWLFYFIARRLFDDNKYAVISSTLIYIFAFSTRLIEGNIANAENFMLLPILAAAYIIISEKVIKKSRHFISHFLAGLILSLAFLTKIVAVFDFAAFTFFILIKPEKDLREKVVNQAVPFVLGFSIPVLATMAYFFLTHNFKDFMDAFLFSNVGYVGYGNKLIIPQGLLYFKSALLLSLLGFLFWKKEKINLGVIFVAIWFAFSLFDSFFSQRPYTHYLIMLLPSFCLMVGSVIANKKERFYLLALLIAGIILINHSFNLNGKLVPYYKNFISFWAGKKDVNSYQSFFDGNTPRDYEIANYIKTVSKPEDKIFVWGNNAQIYKLADKTPIVRYTVAYHITGFPKGLSDMTYAISAKKPKYIVIMPNVPNFPLPLSNYNEKIDIHGTRIYEKEF
jgi:hypothetical protein